MSTNQMECRGIFLAALRALKATYPAQYRAIGHELVKLWPEGDTDKDRQQAFRLFVRIAAAC
ncbi:MAG TPA: hypothetical protein VJA25_03075 [Dehalococcoidia bacterium]|nr:hypothetical protein [Dehalococcoidia bacterium]